MRLQVFLSHNGVCSRRKAMDFIKEGFVTVNGKKITEPSTDIDPVRDVIIADGTRVRQKSFAYLMLNKPMGFVTTKQPQDRQVSVYSLLPKKFHYLSAVGRLDEDSEGLLLFTNDGDTAYKLTHPKFNLDKIYYVMLRGRLLPEHIKKLERGIYMDGSRTSPAKFSNILYLKERTNLRITIHEGKKRQIRRMFAKVGLKVLHLKRETQGPLKIGSIKPGEWRLLKEEEINLIQKI